MPFYPDGPAEGKTANTEYHAGTVFNPVTSLGIISNDCSHHISKNACYVDFVQSSGLRAKVVWSVDYNSKAAANAFNITACCSLVVATDYKVKQKPEKIPSLLGDFPVNKLTFVVVECDYFISGSKFALKVFYV